MISRLTRPFNAKVVTRDNFKVFILPLYVILVHMLE